MINTIRIFFIIGGLFLAVQQSLVIAIVGIILFLLGITGEALEPLFTSQKFLPNSTLQENTSNQRFYETLPRIAYEKGNRTKKKSSRRGVWALPEWVVTTLIIRRGFLWTTAGEITFGMLFLNFVVSRVVIDSQVTRIFEFISDLGGPWNLLAYVITSFLISLPFGYLMHQAYYLGYVRTSIAISFSNPDRVYEYLKLLKEQYNISLEAFDPEGKGLRNTNQSLKKLPFWAFLSPETYQIKGDINNLLQSARRNWQIFNSLYYQMIPDDRFEAVEILARFKEDNYVLAGVARISVLVSWLIYLFYEFILLRNDLSSLDHYFLTLLSSLITSLVVIIIFSRVRAFLGEDSINYKYNHIRSALSEIKSNPSKWKSFQKHQTEVT